VTAWITASEVRRYALVKYDGLNYSAGAPFANETAFDAFLTDTLIPRAQAHINGHCKRDFNVDYPDEKHYYFVGLRVCIPVCEGSLQ
jgi:hypothetical protein